MNGPMLDESLLRFLTGWDTAYAARIVIALAGLLTVAATVRILRLRRCTVVVAGLWLLAGICMLAFAAAPQAVVTFVISTEYILRLRVVMGGLSIFVLLITLESIRVTRLQERYALLWVATAVVMLAAAIFPQGVNILRAVLGVQYVEAMVALAFTFLVLLAFHFSISVSSQQAKLDKNTQRIAILEARIEALEKAAERARQGGAAKPAGPDHGRN